MQSVGVISKSTYWNGPNGVVTKIEVDVNSLTLPELVSIRIQGIDTPVVTLSGDEGAVNKFAVNEWLDSSGELSEWYKEAARYKVALDRVDLPCRFIQVHRSWPTTELQVDMKEKVLTYKLCMTEDGYNIHLTVVVEYDKATVSISLVQGDRRHNKVAIGERTITGAINVETIRAVVRPALDDFIHRLRQLVEQPMVEPIAYS